MTLRINVIYVKRIRLTTEVPITEQYEVKLQVTVRYSGIEIKFVIVHIIWFRITGFEHRIKFGKFLRYHIHGLCG